tara:strand:- start:98 stop:331 length:234 start_codon:yes stop_codon:yes gene_type:complete
MDDFYKNMNNVVVTHKGTPISIAHHKNDKWPDTTEIALINQEDETGGMPIYNYGSTLDSLIEQLIKIKEDLDQGKWL